MLRVRMLRAPSVLRATRRALAASTPGGSSALSPGALADALGASPTDINIPEVVEELSAQHERYETALATNSVVELDRLFLEHDSTLRFGASDAQFGYTAIKDFRAGRPPPGPREILSTSITTYGRPFG